MVPIFHFEQFSTLLIEYLAPLTELSRWGGRSRILMILISQTLLALLLCPPYILCVGLKKVILFSSPQCNTYHFNSLQGELHIFKTSVCLFQSYLSTFLFKGIFDKIIGTFANIDFRHRGLKFNKRTVPNKSVRRGKNLKINQHTGYIYLAL